MTTRRVALVGRMVMLAALANGCGDDVDFEGVVAERTLLPGDNPFGPGDPLYAPQPKRGKPQQVVTTPDGHLAVISLPGTIDRPGNAVAVVDVATASSLGRIAVGSGPYAMAMHPAGRWLVVTLPTSNHLVVIDVARRRVVQRLPTDFYATGAAFDPAGTRLVVANRWRDGVAIYEIAADSDGLRILRRGPWLRVGDNPRDVAISGDGRFAAVGAQTGLDVCVVDLAAATVHQRIALGAPSNGVAFVSGLLVVTTLSASSHHRADSGPDGDGDGQPGDGTPNINFQDLQNEIAVIDPESGVVLRRLTSDTIAGKDYRDVDPRDGVRGGDLLPAPSLRLVGGALPEGIVAVDDVDFIVGYSGSSELQRFRLEKTAEGVTVLAGPTVAAGGHQPMGLALAGSTLVVAHRLGETLGLFDAESLKTRAIIPIGELGGGAFPATDVEIGELVNFVTAPFTVDGDQTCAHCHRDSGNIDKAFAMPLLARPTASSRMTMAYRGAYDTRPWFHEAAMDQSNFLPVLNEFMRIENFCCTDYTLFGEKGPPSDCGGTPPALCATAPNASSSDGVNAARAGREAFASPRPTAFADRDAFVRDAARRLIGRDTSFGDSLFYEHPISGERAPISLDFMGMTRAIGVFLLAAPRLLPNPNPQTGAAARGAAIFARPDVGCIGCHRPPTYALDDSLPGEPAPPDGAKRSPRMTSVVSPARAADGTNLDLLASGFVATFPLASMDRCEDIAAVAICAADPTAADSLREVRFGVPQLRGLWDRARHMLHHGYARNVREVVCTPGHPALHAGEIGRNERDGVPDSHGGTSHLRVSEIAELIAFLETL